MRIAIAGTIGIPAEDLAWAREFMQVDSNDELRVMLNHEALVYLNEYLVDNAIKSKLVRLGPAGGESYA